MEKGKAEGSVEENGSWDGFVIFFQEARKFLA